MRVARPVRQMPLLQVLVRLEGPPPLKVMLPPNLHGDDGHGDVTTDQQTQSEEWCHWNVPSHALYESLSHVLTSCFRFSPQRARLASCCRVVGRWCLRYVYYFLPLACHDGGDGCGSHALGHSRYQSVTAFCCSDGLERASALLRMMVTIGSCLQTPQRLCKR